MSAPPENHHHRQPRRPHTTALLVSAGVAGAVVGVVALAGLAVAVRPLLPSTSPQEPASPSEAPAGAQASVCGLEPGPGEGRFEGFAAGTSWDYVGTTQVPSHQDHGPGLLSEERVPSCWANSPEGAVHAALAYGALTNDVELALPAAEQMLAQGQGRESALGVLREQDPQVVPGEFRGVRVLDFDPDRALVDIAMVVGDVASGPVMSSVVDLRWEDGDWRVATRDNGSMTVPPSTASDPSDYIPVGPESSPSP